MANLKSSVRSRVFPAAHETSVLGSVRSIVANPIAAGYPDLPTVARKAGLSVRTMQRRLAHEGLSYSDLVAESRLNRACELLHDRSWKINKIASALGYSDPANFARAFKNQAGITPTEYRKSATGTPPS